MSVVGSVKGSLCKKCCDSVKARWRDFNFFSNFCNRITICNNIIVVGTIAADHGTAADFLIGSGGDFKKALTMPVKLVQNSIKPNLRATGDIQTMEDGAALAIVSVARNILSAIDVKVSDEFEMSPDDLENEKYERMELAAFFNGIDLGKTFSSRVLLKLSDIVEITRKIENSLKEINKYGYAMVSLWRLMISFRDVNVEDIPGLTDEQISFFKGDKISTRLEKLRFFEVIAVDSFHELDNEIKRIFFEVSKLFPVKFLKREVNREFFLIDTTGKVAETHTGVDAAEVDPEEEVWESKDDGTLPLPKIRHIKKLSTASTASADSTPGDVCRDESTDCSPVMDMTLYDEASPSKRVKVRVAKYFFQDEEELRESDFSKYSDILEEIFDDSLIGVESKELLCLKIRILRIVCSDIEYTFIKKGRLSAESRAKLIENLKTIKGIYGLMYYIYLSFHTTALPITLKDRFGFLGKSLETLKAMASDYPMFYSDIKNKKCFLFLSLDSLRIIFNFAKKLTMEERRAITERSAPFSLSMFLKWLR